MAKAKEMVVINQMPRGAARVRIEGLSDLIMHAWSEKAKAEMRHTQSQEPKKAREKRDPESEFEAAKYFDAEGRDCLLATALKKAIVNAARNLDGYKMTELKQQIFVRGERIPISYSECEMREDMVRLKNGSPDLRYRPAYKEWSAEFEIEWDRKLSASQVLNLLQIAGFSVGIHDWRPERSGEFGRFALVAAGPTGQAGDDKEISLDDVPAVKPAKKTAAKAKKGDKAA